MTSIILHEEKNTEELGKKIAIGCQHYFFNYSENIIIYLIGDLGAGKTTFSRGFLQGLGHKGNVKSPTYTLIEPYYFSDFSVYHFDLYRLVDPEELEFMGMREYFSSNAICLIEWPQQAVNFLPVADIEVYLTYNKNGRIANLIEKTTKGHMILNTNTEESE